MRVHNIHILFFALLAATRSFGMLYTLKNAPESSPDVVLQQRPAPITTQEKTEIPNEQDTKKLLVELFNVVYTLKFPNLNYIFSLFSSPEKQIQYLFQALRECPVAEDAPEALSPSSRTATPPTPWPAHAPSSTTSIPEESWDLYEQLPTQAPDADEGPLPATTYPPLAQFWLTDKLSTQETETRATNYMGGCRPTRYVQAMIAFAPGMTAQALEPNEETLTILKQCQQSGTDIYLCADCNSEEWELLVGKYPALFGPEGIFDPAHVHISGHCGCLVSNPNFFKHIGAEKDGQSTFFIGNNPASCAAAQLAGITTVHYNAKTDENGRSLRKFVNEQNLASHNALRSNQKQPS